MNIKELTERKVNSEGLSRFADALNKFGLRVLIPSETGKRTYRIRLLEIAEYFDEPDTLKQFMLADTNFILGRAKWSLMPIIGGYDLPIPPKMCCVAQLAGF